MVDPGEFARSQRPVGTCRVLVALAKGAPDRTVLSRLEAVGLVVEQVIASTIVGSIAPEAIPRLESDESVAAVERSETLGLHE